MNFLARVTKPLSIACLAYLSALSVAPTKVFAHEIVSLNEFPAWFQEAVAREKRIRKKTRIKIESLNVNKKVLGKATLVEEDEGYWFYNIDIGTGSPVECHIYTSFDGTANSLHHLIEFGIKGVEALNEKKRSGTYPIYTNTGAFGNTPYLALETMYNLGEGENKASGILKAISAQTDDSLQICLHNEMGYRETFVRFFESLIEAFTENQASDAFFESVYKLSINEMPIGFIKETYTKDADGDVAIVESSSSIIPVDASNVARSDGLSRSWGRPDGTLINALEHSIDNGALSSRYELSVKDDKWHVSGEMQGKAIDANLEHEGTLTSGYGNYLATAKLMQSDTSASAIDMWVSEADPLGIINVSMEKIEDNEEANLKFVMGPIMLDVLSNENGKVSQGSITHSSMEMKMDLLFSKGEPILP